MPLARYEQIKAALFRPWGRAARARLAEGAAVRPRHAAEVPWVRRESLVSRDALRALRHLWADVPLAVRRLSLTSSNDARG